MEGGGNVYSYTVANCLVFYIDSKWQILDQKLHPKNLLQLLLLLLLLLLLINFIWHVHLHGSSFKYYLKW